MPPTYFTGFGATNESTPGTKIAVAVGDHVDVVKPGPNFAEAGSGLIQRNFIRPWMHGVPGKQVNNQFWNISFQTEVKAAVLPDAPELGSLLRACGFEETDSGGPPVDTWTYDPYDDPNVADNDGSVTIQAEETTDGKKYVSFGCMFNVEFTFASGDPLMANFTGIGAYETPSDLSSLTSWTLNSGNPMCYMGESNPCQIHSYDMVLRGGSINLNMEPILIESQGAGASTGYYLLPAYLIRRNPATFSFDVMAEDEASFAAWTKYESATSADGVLEFGSSDEVKFTLKNMQFNAPQSQPGEPNMYKLTGIMTGSSGVGPFNIVFT